MSNLKAKINATSLDLSAFLATTLVSGLQADNVPVTVDTKKHVADIPQILATELTIIDKDDNNSQTPVYGDIAICDFVTEMSNQTKKEKALRTGQDLNFDNYV